MPAKIGIKTIPYYMILSRCSGKALDAVDQNVRMFYAFNNPMQQWSFEDRGNGFYSIINRGTHQVLDVNMAGVDNGSIVHTWHDVNADNQLWALEQVGTDTYRIRAKTSGRFLDIIDRSLDAEAGLNIWDPTTSDTQLWLIKEVFEEPKPALPDTQPEENEFVKPVVKRGRKKKISEEDKKAAETFGAVIAESLEAEAAQPKKRKPRKTAGKPRGPRKKTEKAEASPVEPAQALAVSAPQAAEEAPVTVAPVTDEV